MNCQPHCGNFLGKFTKFCYFIHICWVARFEKYAEYALDVPMLMAYRNDNWKDITGASFKVILLINTNSFPQLKLKLALPAAFCAIGKSLRVVNT